MVTCAALLACMLACLALHRPFAILSYITTAPPPPSHPAHFPPVATPVSLNGYSKAGISFLLQSFLFLPLFASSTHTSTQCFALKVRMKRGSQSSEAIPRSLQHRISALDLAPSVAVATPSGEKYSCSPRAVETKL